MVPSSLLFLSTLPARGATCVALAVDFLVKFLSTLPARGATHDEADSLPGHSISIHAPREGSDTKTAHSLSATCNFYPRSPRGERPEPLVPDTRIGSISIHAPREGSDSHDKIGTPFQRDFYPRSPRGERPATANRLQNSQWISIHAPREGSDMSRT